MNKIKSFTLLEVIIVMVMSSIIIAIAYNGYLLFYKQFLSFRNNSEKVARISLMDRLLSSDFSKADYILKKSNGIECIYKTKTIRYRWNDQYIIRNDKQLIDTFNIEYTNLSVKFLEKMAEENKIVDELAFGQVSGASEKYFYYKKRYGVDVLMNEVK